MEALSNAVNWVLASFSTVTACWQTTAFELNGRRLKLTMIGEGYAARVPSLFLRRWRGHRC